jgi:hypothetical protein
MAIVDLFSKRERRKQKQGQEDVFQYDFLPDQFRAQVIHLWQDALGNWRDGDRTFGPPIAHLPNDFWLVLYKTYTREKGVFRLVERDVNPCAQFREFFMSASTEDALDVIELVLRVADGAVRGMAPYERQHWNLADPDAVIEELNGRFREHGIGYEFAGGEIVRVDSKYLHAEAVRPALDLLHGAGNDFAGPLQEFLQAHEHYRKGETKDAITWALKSFESTLKSICTSRSWTFDPQIDSAKKLLEIVFTNNLVPSFLQAHFTALRSVLESGVPTVRNKTSGHGQGPAPTSVPYHLTRYVLHLTASNIVFLIESHKSMK